MPPRALAVALTAVLALTGTACTASATAPTSASAIPEPGVSQSASPTADAPPPAPRDTRTGSELDEPFTVDGIVVVSKDHRVSAAFKPPWVGERHGLHPDATAAFARMAAAARAEGLALSIRSGYRSFADQRASFQRALRQYDEATARRYFAEPGASEHQTGLALDAWDGRNRGTAFARTRQAAWLAAHAHEYGFIVRYPQGKTDITGYAWESWHLRWVGPEVSQRFGPNSSLTLEEYLGLA